MLRHAPPPELAAFDLPGAIGVTGRRNETTLPTQALFLLNSPFVVERADALARRIVGESQWDDARRVREIFRRTLQRDPGALEQEQAIEYVRTIEQAWASLCQALFVTSEFRYID